MNEKIRRPEGLTDEHLQYLDELRESGATNMFGATPYLMAAFDIQEKHIAKKYLMYWMQTFGERHVDE